MHGYHVHGLTRQEFLAAEDGMKKLKLDVDSLAVASFLTVAAAEGRGTVAARELGATPTCNVTQTDCQTNIVFCPSRVVSQCGCTGIA
jgi:hypothetical protein